MVELMVDVLVKLLVESSELLMVARKVEMMVVLRVRNLADEWAVSMV